MTTTPYANEYGVELQGARVLVRKFDTTGFSAASGIILQSSAESRQFKDFGQIVLVGPGETVDGKAVPMPFKEGQVVLIRDGYNVESCTIGTEKFYVVMQDSIQAVLHNAAFEKVEGQQGKYRIVEQKPEVQTRSPRVTLTGESGGHLHLVVNDTPVHLTQATADDKHIVINPHSTCVLGGKVDGKVISVIADQDDRVSFAIVNNRVYLPQELEVDQLADYIEINSDEQYSFSGDSLFNSKGERLHTL